MRAAAMGLACLTISVSAAYSAEDEEDAAAQPAVPNLYLDLRTSYASVPAGTLGLGFGTSSLSAALQALAVRRGATLPNGLPAAKSIAVDLPLTVDVDDRVSLYGGVSGSTTDIGDGWSRFDITSWNIGVQADLYRQDGGAIPTITLQSTLTQSVPNDHGMTNSLNNILEFDYALDEDETRGWLTGVQHTYTTIASPFASIRPNTILYAGGYYQWPSNWKFTGRLGMQSFGGAQLAGRALAESFMQPILRLDLDRMDDNDNRLFGITAQIAWTPKPSYQLTLRTPLYAIRN
ncbi:hypothetical protein C7U92_21490 [Bradyrhizobium sp. WBOS7]|uniref:Transporter n=1 Tax=Bradyrhizobium betae TaxID=244734 RepID=A0AAE9N5K6_9BRAD|nr:MULTISPECIES: hypothetical protein [Bradyrhizobium]MDD1574305.1 hypothetical protein [Bradyrhizobium sp. WBOS1]UUO33719.1 hypothetical protein DCK84_03435 [Bradyrhizobium sp. WBOS01]MDD1529973.1 hypothetical protein [Bradyrhizobium sp. WBOS2]MDD1579271.1 hypothetical protein [Bradyrhizobium sp. WBOS7]MDD1603529.1 hypothetical protein [Bradyrhizobium sp. WBOS16]